MKYLLKHLCAACLAFAATGLVLSAHAEKADATRPLNISADRLSYDDVRQVNTFTGNVVITRGTLQMKGEKVVVTTDAAGYRFATLHAPATGLATFRQKRDGGPDLWIDGQAKRIEYTDRTEIVQLFDNAQMRRLEGARVTDQVNGDFISYDSRAEYYTVNNRSGNTAHSTAPAKGGDGRVHVTIQPRLDPALPPSERDGGEQ